MTQVELEAFIGTLEGDPYHRLRWFKIKDGLLHGCCAVCCEDIRPEFVLKTFDDAGFVQDLALDASFEEFDAATQCLALESIAHGKKRRGLVAGLVSDFHARFSHGAFCSKRCQTRHYD